MIQVLGGGREGGGKPKQLFGATRKEATGTSWDNLILLLLIMVTLMVTTMMMMNNDDDDYDDDEK